MSFPLHHPRSHGHTTLQERRRC